MDALQNTKDIIGWVDEGNVGVDNFYLVLAQTHASIAQAEQLKRIADLIERWVGPEPVVDPELADYRRNCFPGESIDEYQHRIAATPENDRY